MNLVANPINWLPPPQRKGQLNRYISFLLQSQFVMKLEQKNVVQLKTKLTFEPITKHESLACNM